MLLEKPPTPDPTLEELLEQAQKHEITPEENRLQRISWVFGQLAFNRRRHITREMVEEADRELHPEDYPPKN